MPFQIFFSTANCKLYHSAMKPRITHNVPKLMYFNLTKSQICKGNSARRGRFKVQNGTTYPDLPYTLLGNIDLWKKILQIFQHLILCSASSIVLRLICDKNYIQLQIQISTLINELHSNLCKKMICEYQSYCNTDT